MDKCKPFFQAIKRNEADFRENEDYEVTFQGPKKYPASPSLLSKPVTEETLYLYLTISESAISGALVQEERGAQKPVYYSSKSLLDVKIRYQRMEKMVLTLFVISRKLKHYFQYFHIIVLTEHPLKSIMENPQATGRIIKWVTELRPYGIKYESRTVIKEQVLAELYY